MARDLEYDISPEAYAVFKSSIELRMELGLFYNAWTVKNAMDRARMNTTIRTFETLFRVLKWRCLYCWGSQEYLCWWFPGSCEWYLQCWFFQAYLCLIFGPPYKQACYKWREVLYRDRTRNEEFDNIQSEYNRTPVDCFRCKFVRHRGMKTNLWNEKGHANDHFNSKTRWCDLKWLKLQ